MRHDLSFIEEPDWQRESTISPTFLAIVILSLFLIIGITGSFYAFSEKISRRYQLGRVNNQNAEIAERADQIQQYQRKLTTWRQNLTAVEQLSEQRLLWSRQLHALQGMVPDDITLTQLSVTAHEIKDDQVAPPRAGRPGTPEPPKTRIQYTMTITGIAHGDHGQEVITDFADRIPYDLEIGRKLLSRELKNISGGQGDREKSFTIVCIYNPIG